MKKLLLFAIILSLIFVGSGCKPAESSVDIVATTKPVYDFTVALCQDTGITVDLLVTEQLSCLHDYTLQVRQMRKLEAAQTIVMSGAGLEAFLHDVLEVSAHKLIDASAGIALHCGDHSHDHEGHSHEQDPHIWLSVANARAMAQNISEGLKLHFPAYQDIFSKNLSVLNEKLDALDTYGREQLSHLSSRDLITFHDGFTYFAEYWDLHILHAMEEEAGSEASAAELKELIEMVNQYDLPAIFVEENGSTAASRIIASETGASVFSLNMGMSEKDYFESMYQNIDNIKEALG